MTQVLSNFIKALRAYDVRVSTAESIDAAAALELVGFERRPLVKEALSQVLAKTPDDKARFDECFERYFTFESVSAERDTDANAERRGDDNPAAGLEAGQGGSGTGGGDGGLAALLERGDGAALQQLAASAARNVQLQNIRLFTQRGMYIRRMLEDMGIEALDDLLYALVKADDDSPRALRLKERKARLIETVAELVDRQMLMYTANAWPKLREEMLEKTPLARIAQDQDRGALINVAQGQAFELRQRAAVIGRAHAVGVDGLDHRLLYRLLLEQARDFTEMTGKSKGAHLGQHLSDAVEKQQQKARDLRHRARHVAYRDDLRSVDPHPLPHGVEQQSVVLDVAADGTADVELTAVGDMASARVQ